MPTKKPLSFEGVHQFLRTLFADDPHAKRVLSLAGATLEHIRFDMNRGIPARRDFCFKHPPWLEVDAMSQAYSLDLRQRAVSLVAAGQSRRAVARLLSLGESSVIRWTQRHAETGNCSAKPRGGTRPLVLLDQRDWVLARMAAVPDLTIRALRTMLAERGTNVTADTVWRFLRRERLTFKKKSARRRTNPA